MPSRSEDTPRARSVQKAPATGETWTPVSGSPHDQPSFPIVSSRAVRLREGRRLYRTDWIFNGSASERTDAATRQVHSQLFPLAALTHGSRWHAKNSLRLYRLADGCPTAGRGWCSRSSRFAGSRCLRPVRCRGRGGVRVESVRAVLRSSRSHAVEPIGGYGPRDFRSISPPVLREQHRWRIVPGGDRRQQPVIHSHGWRRGGRRDRSVQRPAAGRARGTISRSHRTDVHRVQQGAAAGHSWPGARSPQAGPHRHDGSQGLWRVVGAGQRLA